MQCGFCTSGMLLTAEALLDEEPSPTEADVMHYLRGNLCRCTGYRKIVDAILACAATGARESAPARSASSADPSAGPTRWTRSRDARATSPT